MYRIAITMEAAGEMDLRREVITNISKAVQTGAGYAMEGWQGKR